MSKYDSGDLSQEEIDDRKEELFVNAVVEEGLLEDVSRGYLRVPQTLWDRLQHLLQVAEQDAIDQLTEELNDNEQIEDERDYL